MAVSLKPFNLICPGLRAVLCCIKQPNLLKDITHSYKVTSNIVKTVHIQKKAKQRWDRGFPNAVWCYAFDWPSCTLRLTMRTTWRRFTAVWKNNVYSKTVVVGFSHINAVKAAHLMNVTLNFSTRDFSRTDGVRAASGRAHLTSRARRRSKKKKHTGHEWKHAFIWWLFWYAGFCFQPKWPFFCI